MKVFCTFYQRAEIETRPKWLPSPPYLGAPSLCEGSAFAHFTLSLNYRACSSFLACGSKRSFVSKL